MTSLSISHPSLAGPVRLLSEWISCHMAYAGLPGLSLAIIVDQEVLWARGFGCADVESATPATPDTLYRIASITKLFTATAALQLRDAGKLQLDEPITTYLPWFNISDQFAEDPPITLRHLLTHTSGLPREPRFPHWMTAQFPSLEQIKEQLSELETSIPRETKLKYSNLALALAGEVVAAVSGIPYSAYVQAHILDPLEMKDTFVTPVPRDHPRLATGYGRRLPDGSRALSPYTDAQGLTAAFNMATTVRDLARFAMFHLRATSDEAHPVLHGRTRSEMQRVHFLAQDWQVGWGLGFAVRREDEQAVVGHGGAVLGYRTQLTLRPTDGLGAVVFINADDGAPEEIASKALKWLGPAIKKAQASPAANEEFDPAWEAYVGRYRAAWGDMAVLVYDGQLMMVDPTVPEPLEAATTLEPAGEHVFRAHEPDFHGGSHGELMRFELDESGRAARIVDANGNVEDRIEHW